MYSLPNSRGFFCYPKPSFKKKKVLCEQNKIKLVYFDYEENDINNLLKIIQK